MEDVDLSWRFWGSLIGIVVGIGIAALLFFLLIGAAWARWGALGSLIFFGAILIGVAYVYDRRQARKYEES
jgi:uncharacterized membrane protein